MNRKERKKALLKVTNLLYVMTKIHFNDVPSLQHKFLLPCELMKTSAKAQKQQIKQIAQNSNKLVWQLTETDFDNYARQCLTILQKSRNVVNNIKAILETNNSKTTNKKA